MRSDSERERERERHIQTEPYQINVVMWLFALCERQRFRKIDKNKVKKNRNYMRELVVELPVYSLPVYTYSDMKCCFYFGQYRVCYTSISITQTCRRTRYTDTTR